MIIGYAIKLLIAILSSLVAFYLTNSLIYLFITLFIYLIYFALYEFFYLKKERMSLMRSQDLNIFIHDFYLNFISDKNIEEAINGGAKNCSKAFNEQLNLLKDFTPTERLNNLIDYFNNNLYILFLKTINLSSDCKSSFITIDFIFEENNKLIINRKLAVKNTLKSLIEFIFLWLTTFMIMIILRLSINNYFNNISQNPFYLAGVAIFFLFFLLSFHLFEKSIIKGFKIYEG